jgi:glycosyltransferase involved in cell wall biosynthesis
VRVLVVAPSYEEAANIDEFLRRVRASLPDADVLVVDDNSPDGTGELAERLAGDLGRIEVLHRPGKSGLGTAYRAGFGVGIERGYDILVQMDSDLSHDPAVLPQLIRKVDEGADVAIGSRYVPGGSIPHWSWYRRALSRYGNLYACRMLAVTISDATSGFRAYRADALEAVDFASTRAKGYGFQIELAYRMQQWGGKIAEIPIVFTDRVRGRSKMSWQIATEELWLVTLWGLRDRWKHIRSRFR